MALATSTQAMAMLRAIGFDNSSRAFGTAVRGFQTGWNLGTALVVDGKYGPKTDAALKLSYARYRKGQSTMSAHFSYVEFRCKCGGKYASCQRVWMKRNHIRRLEAYRAKVGPVRVVSGCRCIGHNRAVGGASSSQHMYGVGTDIQGLKSLATVRSYRYFAGLGWQQSTGRVVHVDSRDIGGHNTTGSSTSNPASWRYSW